MPPTVASFPRRTTDKVRYADTDRQGHVNNAVFATFLETGRVEVLYDTRGPLAEDGAEWVIARLTLEFLGEIRWPGEVEIGTGVRRLGTSSVTLAQLVEQDGRPVASAETVIVHVDSTTRKARALGTRARETLGALGHDGAD